MQYIAKHRSKAMISVEVEKPDRKGLEQLAQVANVVFYSKSWAWVSFSTSEDRAPPTSRAIGPRL